MREEGEEAFPSRKFSAGSHTETVSAVLYPHSTRTPAMDTLYNTTNGQDHNNSTTCCTTNSPPTDKNLPHRNARAQHLHMPRCSDVANFCPLVVNLLYNKL